MGLKTMAESYNQEADRLHEQIEQLREEMKTAPKPEKWKLKERIKTLEEMYDDVKHTAIYLEGYYNKKPSPSDRR